MLFLLSRRERFSEPDKNGSKLLLAQLVQRQPVAQTEEAGEGWITTEFSLSIAQHEDVQ